LLNCDFICRLIEILGTGCCFVSFVIFCKVLFRPPANRIQRRFRNSVQFVFHQLLFLAVSIE